MAHTHTHLGEYVYYKPPKITLADISKNTNQNPRKITLKAENLSKLPCTKPFLFWVRIPTSLCSLLFFCHWTFQWPVIFESGRIRSSVLLHSFVYKCVFFTPCAEWYFIRSYLLIHLFSYLDLLLHLFVVYLQEEDQEAVARGEIKPLLQVLLSHYLWQLSILAFARRHLLLHLQVLLYLHQLRLVIYPVIYRFFNIPGGVSRISSINSMSTSRKVHQPLHFWACFRGSTWAQLVSVNPFPMQSFFIRISKHIHKPISKNMDLHQTRHT